MAKIDDSVKKKVPELRFKGFTDEWEERKLGELGKIYTGNTPKTSDLDNWTDNKEGHIWITPTDIDKLIMSDSDRHLSEKGWSKARKIPENSVLITSIASIGKNTINAVPVAFNQQINAIVPEKNDSYFILSAMIKDTARFASVAGQTATAIINKTTFEKFQIATPSYEEQQKIGTFFKQLDDTITLHQRKLEKLQKLKKAALQSFFPKKDELMPKVRFANFSGLWKQRKLGAITDSFSGGTPTAGKAEYYGGEIPFIRSGEISSDSTELFITDAELNNSSAKMVGIGDILYALYGATSGETSISRINGAINQAILAIRPTKGDDPYMIVQWLKKQKETIISTYLQGGQGNLSGSIVKDLLITLPKNKDEQAKVGSFFKQLDQTITLHQRKLDLLKEQKKGFLQNMFV
ncbi:restriction endonuclease subunit S [Tetragenococcus halophilus]|uniref:restriction endonuclease subunit S n=1 Tax=Tetragenococcus halophilus TaxID=51669 RepID=UPI00209B1F17|nr:restriction endonuclease subunit S [Tetragenococcus halophilus]MCO8287668.1 restriction endonuclease subunit S [Tetragenococcus halophilus]MDN6526628.1 restriction endonuclease subunit S [Tetragenococcus halophilus]MDN6607440.1 restriction endonuclease subunit S [Tetragenococcus halophilus]